MTVCLSLGRAFPVGLVLLKCVNVADTTVVGREMGASDIDLLVPVECTGLIVQQAATLYDCIVNWRVNCSFGKQSYCLCVCA
jgi:hypothetical protein